jgi:hypothetical protein
MTSLGVRTLTEGFVFRVQTDITKGQFISLCEDLENLFGPGNRFEPLPGKGLRWAKWSGMQDSDTLGGKEIRLLPHQRSEIQFVPWPVVESDARQTWKDDKSLAIKAGWYKSQLAAFGSAPKWRRLELELVRECFQRLGVRVSKVICIRRLRYKDDALARAHTRNE